MLGSNCPCGSSGRLQGAGQLATNKSRGLLPLNALYTAARLGSSLGTCETMLPWRPSCALPESGEAMMAPRGQVSPKSSDCTQKMLVVPTSAAPSCREVRNTRLVPTLVFH